MNYFFTLICVAIAWYTWRTVRNARRSRGWPSVPGVVVTSRVVQVSSRTGRSPLFKLTYSYSVNGKGFEGSRIEYGGVDKGRRPLDLERSYPVGKHVTVFYDPASPGSCTLATGVPRQLFGLLAIGGMFAILAVYMIVLIALSWMP